MKNIKVEILNPSIIEDTIKMMAIGARLTQHSHNIKDLEDFNNLYNTPASSKLIAKLNELPHPTLLHFTKINVVVFGASRRFLAQITRHQENVKFMSGSLQYSDFSDNSDVAVPYEIIDTEFEEPYKEQCKEVMDMYASLQKACGVDNDSAGYVAPQGLRNVLIISATPFQWKHMIAQRICRRNTAETRYVMLLIWNELYKLAPQIFTEDTTGCFCMTSFCKEGSMSCHKPINFNDTPDDILHKDFSKLYKENKC